MKLARWIVVTAALAAIVWLSMRSNDRDSSVDPAADSKGEASAYCSEPQPDPVETMRDGREVVGASEPAPAATAEAKDLVTLHVIERDSKKPIVGAQIRVVEYRSLKGVGWNEVRDDLALLDRWATEIGKSYTSDANGAATVARVTGTSILAAAKDERFGLVEFDSHANEVTVELARDDSLTVQTLDAHGSPLGGVPVLLRALDVGLNEIGEHVRVVTAMENGTASIAHARFVVEHGKHHEFAVRAEIVSTQPVQSAIDPNDWPTRPILLRLPPLGSAQVRMLGGDAKPERDESFIQLLALRPNESNEEALRRIRVDGVRASSLVGEAQFESVAVGTELFAEASAATPILVKRSSGPQLPGESVVINIGGPESLAMLHGRVLDADGHPIVNSSIDFDLELGRDGNLQSSMRSITQLDANGEFRIEVAPSSGEQLTRRLAFHDREVRGSPKEASFELHVDGDLPGGVTELGDLRLQIKPLVIDGVVVDDEDRPVERAGVQILRPNPTTQRVPWIESRVFGEVTGADGRFVFRADWNDATVGVQVNTEQRTPMDPVSFATGSHDVRIRIHRSGTITGTVLIDHGAKLDDYIVAFIPQGESEPRGMQELLREMPEPGRAQFSIRGVPPGTARLSFRLRTGAVLAEIAEIAIIGGKTSDDPRLKDVDLRGLSHAIQITVRDASGEAATNSVVRVRPRDGAREWLQAWADEGHTTVTLRSLPADFVVGAAGCRTKRFDGVSADLDVTLDQGIPIDLGIDASSLAAFATKAKFVVRLIDGNLTTVDDRLSREDEGRIDANGRAAFKLGEPGRFHIRLRLDRVVDEHHKSLTLSCTPETIEVRDATETQHFDISISAAERAKIDAFVRE